MTSQRIRPASGEQLLAAVADTLLGGGTMVGMAATALAASLAEVETALRAVGALPAGSPAVARLAALCQQRSVPLRGDLATRARATGLPGPWASVLAQRRDGPGEGRTGVLPLAAVLPETDGARFVLAGLSSWERQLSMPVVGLGLASPAPGVPGRPAVLLVGPRRRRALARRPDRPVSPGGPDVPAGIHPAAAPGCDVAGHHPDRFGVPGHRVGAAALAG